MGSRTAKTGYDERVIVHKSGYRLRKWDSTARIWDSRLAGAGFGARVRDSAPAARGHGAGRRHFRESVLAASRARRSEATSSTMTAIWRRLVMSAPYSGQDREGSSP